MLISSLWINKKAPKKECIILFLTLFFLFLAVPLFWGKDNIPPRVYFGGVSLGGPVSEAQGKIDAMAASFEQESVEIVFQGKKIETTLGSIGLKIDRSGTYANLKNVAGVDDSSFKHFFKWWSHLIFGFKAPAYYSFDKVRLETLTGSKFNVNLTPVQEASLKTVNDKIILVPAKEGLSIDSMTIVAQILRDLKEWRSDEIQVGLAKISPDVSTEEAGSLKQELDQLLDYPFALRAQDKNFRLSRPEILSWMDIQKVEKQETNSIAGEEGVNVIMNIAITGQSFSDSKKGYGLVWDIDRGKVKSFLEREAQSAVYRKPVNGTLIFENGAIREAGPSQSEITIDIDSAVSAVAQSFKKGEHFVSLPVKENPASLSTQKVKELGIDFLIGRGESNFTGSPNNRKHNIGVGASKFNGVIIGKEEEFSFLTALGPVDQSTGYLPELVIKQDKTVPEFGGGMCQVSTTAFRAAVNSGLRVTERQNHAYPVQYYSPQGTDATVYIPHPDLKFVNDTSAPILIQTRIEGNMLTFEYFGKSDNRSVMLEGPRVWDKKSDGSMKTEWIQKVFDKNGKLMFQKNFLSKYDSPSKYPHPGDEKPPTDKKKKKKKH